MVDITEQFRSCLSDISRRPGIEPLDKDRILKPRKPPHTFSVQARSILGDINKVDRFLKEENMSDLSSEERDEIENGALSLLRTTKLLITKLKKDVDNTSNIGSQVKTHFLGVGEVLDKKLKDVSKNFTKQKEIRLESMGMTREMSRLHDGSSLFSPDPHNNETGYAEDEEYLEEELSPDEIQLFQKENATMYEELRKTQTEVQSIENKVVKIAELQELFSEKILEQKDDIDLVSRNALAASENIKDGNEELRKAIQNKASIRVYILFSLLVLSFSLLFLDWYNP
ncbi:syntaxin-18 [Lepeophtheirus salmonis]|uniref:syntaxin-18 n=1 Tax=Lepeophtheirus salmonis TaxID=72036 RepID=UPI001AEB4460|nr:syntaxin-18-like [Lepeophtheirus salmonis]